MIAWQGSHFDWATLAHSYPPVAAAIPKAEVKYLVHVNWPVHTHPDVRTALPAKLVLLPLPTDAPWTNPVPDRWRRRKADLLHHRPLIDD